MRPITELERLEKCLGPHLVPVFERAWADLMKAKIPFETAAVCLRDFVVNTVGKTVREQRPPHEREIYDRIGLTALGAIVDRFTVTKSG